MFETRGMDERTSNYDREGFEKSGRAKYSHDNRGMCKSKTLPMRAGRCEREVLRMEGGCGWQLSNFGGIETSKKKFESNADGPTVDANRIKEVIENCEDENNPGIFYHRNDPQSIHFPIIPQYISTFPDEFPSFYGSH
eukprot:UN27201